MIYGGLGRVGHFAIQFSKLLGAKVYATVSNDRQKEIVRQLGANDAINYKKEKLEDVVNRHTAGQGFDVVFDVIGNQNQNHSF